MLTLAPSAQTHTSNLMWQSLGLYWVKMTSSIARFKSHASPPESSTWMHSTRSSTASPWIQQFPTNTTVLFLYLSFEAEKADIWSRINLMSFFNVSASTSMNSAYAFSCDFPCKNIKLFFCCNSIRSSKSDIGFSFIAMCRAVTKNLL